MVRRDEDTATSADERSGDAVQRSESSRPADSDVDARLHALELRLAEVEARLAGTGSASRGSGDSPAGADRAHSTSGAGHDPGADDTYWALDGLKARVGSPGAVLFTGSVDVGGGHLDHQWARPTEAVLARDWAEHADSLAALGHPVRLAMLRLLLDGAATVAQLVDELQLGSTGVAYHHLHQMAAAGWIDSPRRGEWAVSPGRVVPLMTIIIATEQA